MSRARKADAPARDYEVGYKKPPVATRFQPGQSGNPRGKPKASLSIGQLLEKALARRVSVKEKNGQSRRMAMLEVIIQGVVNGAARQDAKSLRLLMLLMQQHRETSDAAPANYIPEVGDEELLRDFLALHGVNPSPGANVDESGQEKDACDGDGQ